MAAFYSWADDIPDRQIPIYFARAYQSLLADHDGTKAAYVRISDRDTNWFLPLQLRELGGGVYEAYSAYGYGGLWNFANKPLSVDIFSGLQSFLATEGVVCAFIRHSPFLENQEILPRQLSEFNRTTYVRKLLPCSDLDAFCISAPQKLRWSVNYARRQGLSASFYPLDECDESLIRDFFKIYRELMGNKNTGNYYYFSEQFFLNHASFLGNQCELAVLRNDASGELVAAAFFLLDDMEWAHYHLSASQRAYMRLQPVELLMAEAIVRYGNAGYKNLHLGGGHSIDGLDGLSRFKKKFSSDDKSFYISRWIFDELSYKAERMRMPLKNPSLFLIKDALGNA